LRKFFGDFFLVLGILGILGILGVLGPLEHLESLEKILSARRYLSDSERIALKGDSAGYLALPMAVVYHLTIVKRTFDNCQMIIKRH